MSVLVEVALHEALDVELIGERVGGHAGGKGKGVERGYAASEFQDGGRAVEQGSSRRGGGSGGTRGRREEKVGGRRQPVCEQGRYFPQDFLFSPKKKSQHEKTSEYINMKGKNQNRKHSTCTCSAAGSIRGQYAW